jgi:hypothetical protein
MGWMREVHKYWAVCLLTVAADATIRKPGGVAHYKHVLYDLRKRHAERVHRLNTAPAFRRFDYAR